ncbi:MAG TPA: DUF402 domain-containing protein, partial [Ktedonobacterales bacterium]|nr:DUF402 domain-containing protein [Ktedonobacterales bacterium]
EGQVALTYEGELIERLPNGVVLDAVWTWPPLALDYTTFETGAHFTEWYYTDHWYNIFRIHGADGTLKGWYCNVAAPAVITEDTIACRDLILDLWVTPEGGMLILDEEEFAADTTLDEPTRAAARTAIIELRQLVEERVFPFSMLPTAETTDQ